ncbi:MAG: glycosyltransferase family 4 protein [Elusimicrobiota bacterium]|jgi:glycosyltransferase involved in cell wall biosynthesis
MLKTLQVSEAHEWSGGTAQLLALSAGLRAKGWDVKVACRPGSGLEKYARDRGFQTFAVGMREDYDLISAWQLARFIQANSIDVVHAHHNRSHSVCLLAKLILRLLGSKAPALLVSRRVSFPPGRNPFSRWKYRSRLIDRIVAVAEAVKDVLTASGVPAAQVCVIRSGVDTERFAPRAATPEFKRSLGLPEGRTIVGKIANASPWKGQNVLLEAAAILVRKNRKVHFLFAGRDTDGAWLKGEVARLGLAEHVTLLGFRTDVPEILSCLDVSVNAAVRGEGLSGALRESLAMSVPVVASDVAGNRELLGEAGQDFMFPPGDAAALAARLEWALDHAEPARNAARTWRDQTLSQFSLDNTVAETDALYRSLLGR